jgi:hypothetical protein
LARWVLLIALALAAAAPSPASAATVVNGGFESGDLSGWEARRSTSFGKWYAYQGTKPPIPHERGAVSVQPPPRGTYAAITDQANPDSLLLFQDLRLEPGSRYKLSLLAYYDTYAALAIPSPDTLSVDEGTLGPQANQQFRIDVIRPEAPVDSVGSGDVLLTLFRTRAVGARKMSPTRLVADLAPFAGQTVRLRIAVAATEEVLSAGVDAVELSAPDGTFTSSRKRIRPGKPRPNLKKGTVLLPVQVPEAGRLVARSRGGKIRSASLKTTRAGKVALRLHPSRKGRTILERRHKLRVGITLTWKPLSGGRQKLRVPVVFKLRKS